MTKNLKLTHKDLIEEALSQIETLGSEDAFGLEENEEGKTNDVRALQQNKKLEAPISGAQQVSNKGTAATTDSSFYGDE